MFQFRYVKVLLFQFRYDSGPVLFPELPIRYGLRIWLSTFQKKKPKNFHLLLNTEKHTSRMQVPWYNALKRSLPKPVIGLGFRSHKFGELFSRHVISPATLNGTHFLCYGARFCGLVNRQVQYWTPTLIVVPSCRHFNIQWLDIACALEVCAPGPQLNVSQRPKSHSLHLLRTDQTTGDSGSHP